MREKRNRYREGCVNEHLGRDEVKTRGGNGWNTSKEVSNLSWRAEKVCGAEERGEGVSSGRRQKIC